MSCRERLELAREIVEEELGVDVEVRDDNTLVFEVGFEGGYPPSAKEEDEMDRIEDEVAPVLDRIEELGLKVWAIWDWFYGEWGFGVEVTCQ